MVGGVPDVITCAKFQIEISMGYDFTGGRIFDFCIDFSMGLTTVQRYCAACDCFLVVFCLCYLYLLLAPLMVFTADMRRSVCRPSIVLPVVISRSPGQVLQTKSSDQCYQQLATVVLC